MQKGIAILDRRLCAAALLLAGLSGLPGCTAEAAPPWDELPLRDVFAADPRALSALEPGVQSALAERSYRNGYEFDMHLRGDGLLSEWLDEADRQLEAEERDALVFAVIEHSGEDVSIRAWNGGSGMDRAGGTLCGAPANVGAFAEHPRERAALRMGRPGGLLFEMAEAAGACTVERVLGWPIGAVAHGGRLYVNASWLVIHSASNQEGISGAPSGETQSPAPAFNLGPPLRAQEFQYNPFNLPHHLDECQDSVKDLCKCANGGSCTHQPASPGDGDANSECTWAASSDTNADALCALALMSVTEVRACVERGGEDCALPVDRNSALVFAADPVCRGYLDTCLWEGRPDPSEDLSCGEKCGCSRGDPQKCDAEEFKSCRMAGQVGENGAPAPWRTLFFLCAPLLYVYSCSRRGNVRRPGRDV